MSKQIPEFMSYKIDSYHEKATRQVVRHDEWNEMYWNLQSANNYHDDYWKSVHNYLFEDDDDGASMKTQWDWINNMTVSAEVTEPGTTPTVERIFEGDHYNFHFTLPKGDRGLTGPAAGFGTPTATVNSTVGTPSVIITSSGPDTAKIFNFAFSNLKGNTGDAAGFGTPTITVGTGTDDPTATITSSGPNTAKVFNFAFNGLKGKKGDKGDKGDPGAVTKVNNKTGDVTLWKDIESTLEAGETTLIIEDSFILSTSTINCYSNVYGVSPKTIEVEDGVITLTFKEQENDLGIKVRVS